jgi:hypothetical protein
VTVIRIACIVEGRGDDVAVPVVVHRIAQVEAPWHTVVAETVVRRDRGLLVQQKHLAADIEFVARKLGGKGGILVLFDADDDCPASLGPVMQQWAQAERPDIPIAVVLAMREFEAWFLATAESLRGHRNLPDTIEDHPAPETVRDAKGWLTGQMPRPKSYSPSVDQAPLARIFNIERARSRCDSFSKLYREVSRLLQALG